LFSFGNIYHLVMKKFIALGLAFFLSVSSLIVTSQAGGAAHYAQYTYNSGYKQGARHHSYRRGYYNYYRSHARRSARYNRQYGRQYPAYVNSYRQRSRMPMNRVHNYRATQEKVPSNARRITLRQVQKQVKEMKRNNVRPTSVDRADFYTFEIPDGFYMDSDGVYRDQSSTIAFRIVKTPKDYSCVQLTFELCAIDLGKEFKDSQNLVQLSQMDRTMRWRQTVDNAQAYIPTLVESFHAVGYQNNKHVYYNFSALDPRDGSVVRVESVALGRDTNRVAKTMNRVFESFRFQINQ